MITLWVRRALSAGLVVLGLGLPGCASSGGQGGGGGGSDAGVDLGGGSDGARDGSDAGETGDSGRAVRVQQSHSSALAISPDHARLFVVHPDADSVSVIDAARRTILHEVLLAAVAPALDDAGRYQPAVAPRALALSSDGATVYVTGQRSGRVYAIDAAAGTIKAQTPVCSEPIGVLVSADDTRLFVACAQDDEVVQLDAADLSVIASLGCARKPWALAWAADGKTLLATHFLGPGVSSFATQPLAQEASWAVADGPPTADDRGVEDPTEPHGEVRGLYDAVVRPGTSELWVAHLMLGTDTPQPELDFQRTVFPSLSVLETHAASADSGDDGGPGAAGTQLARLSVAVNHGDSGAFGDVVSGPRALAFSDDGRLAFVADAASEDILIVDAERRIESTIIRPLPGHLPEGIVWADGKIYVDERNSEDLVAYTVTRDDSGAVIVTPDGAPFATLAVDPMPAQLRLGQKLFYSANSDDLPLTQNHWVACATCHLEGRSDAVTWHFAQGPRDTPSNAGGLLDTGFLFRTADRTQVQDYWKTINVEQGGHFQLTEPSQRLLLDALADFVNHAIPAPTPPSLDASRALSGSALAARRAQGAAVFTRLGCDSCHSGPAYTDSGAGNSLLDLSGPVVSTPVAGGVLLHDVGTCVTDGTTPDLAHEDKLGDPRDACAFDTPQLRGLTDSAPYLHDGSAATLDDVVTTMLNGTTPPGAAPPVLSTDDRGALVEFLRGL